MKNYLKIAKSRVLKLDRKANALLGKRYAKYVILLIILIGAFGARLYKLDNPIADWHSWRQADTASVSRIYVEEGIDLLYPRYYDVSSVQTGAFNENGLRLVEFPIYNVLNAVLAKNIPIKYPERLLSKTWKDIGYSPTSVELWGRLVSIVASLVSVVAIFYIGSRLYNSWVGLLSAFFFSFIPYSIYYSRVILPEPLAITFGLLGLSAFLYFIQKENKWMLYLSGMFFALSLLIKPFTFFYLIPAIYLVWRKFGVSFVKANANLLIRMLIFSNIVIIPLFAWRIWINKNPIGIPHFEWAFNGDGIRFKPTFWRWIFAERVGNLILGVWGVVPFVYSLIHKSAVKFKYFIHWFLFGGFIYVSIVATANVRHDYYQTFLVAPIALALGYGVYALWTTTLFNKIATRILLVFSLLIMFMAGGVLIKEYYKVNHPEIVSAGLAADRLLPKDAMIIAPYTGDTAFLYQTDRYGWPVVDTSFEKLIERGARYFVAVNFADPDMQKLLQTNKVVARTDSYIIIDLLLKNTVKSTQ